MTNLAHCFSITALPQAVIWTLIKGVLKIPESAVQTIMEGESTREEDEDAKNVCARWMEVGKNGEEKDLLTRRTKSAKVDMNQDKEEQGQSRENRETDEYVHSVNIFIGSVAHPCGRRPERCK